MESDFMDFSGKILEYDLVGGAVGVNSWLQLRDFNPKLGYFP